METKNRFFFAQVNEVLEEKLKSITPTIFFNSTGSASKSHTKNFSSGFIIPTKKSDTLPKIHLTENVPSNHSNINDRDLFKIK